MRDNSTTHTAVANDLQRRRELARLTKPELIDFIIRFQNEVTPLVAMIEAAFGDES